MDSREIRRNLAMINSKPVKKPIDNLVEKITKLENNIEEVREMNKEMLSIIGKLIDGKKDEYQHIEKPKNKGWFY